MRLRAWESLATIFANLTVVVVYAVIRSGRAYRGMTIAWRASVREISAPAVHMVPAVILDLTTQCDLLVIVDLVVTAAVLMTHTYRNSVVKNKLVGV